jgi:hypothetical protein
MTKVQQHRATLGATGQKTNSTYRYSITAVTDQKQQGPKPIGIQQSTIKNRHPLTN